ncbi:MAG: FG-GAP-like repeat-containing protein [Candidatus Latescibacterota bacterium]
MGSPNNYGPGNDPATFVALGDVDEDGDLDIALAIDGQQNRIYENDGTGAFAFDYPVGGATEASYALALADFDNSGSLDVAVANNSGQINRIVLNDGGGQFNTSPTFGPGGGDTQALTVGDFDGDGLPDLAVGNAGQGNEVYLKTGASGTDYSTRSPVSFGPGNDASRAMALADFDNDGDLDIALAVNGGQNVLYMNENSLVPPVVENTTATGTVGVRGVLPNDLVEVVTIGLTGDSTVSVTGVSVVLLDLTASTGFDPATDVAQLLVFESADNVLDTGDTQVGSVNNSFALGDTVTVPVSSTPTVGITERFYIVGVEIATSATGGHAFKVAFPTGGVQLNNSTSIGTAIVPASDGDRFEIGINTGVTLTDVSSGAGITGSANSYGVAWGDVNADGHVDLYVSNVGGANVLYTNNGDGTFSDASAAPLNATQDSRSALWGDYDNDGDLDLYVVNNNTANLLLQNDGVSSFVDVGDTSVVGETGPCLNASWVDVDSDGDIDLYLVNDGATFLFENDHAAFTNPNGGPHVTASTRSAAWADFDDDGDADAYVVLNGVNRLYRNDGGLSFTEIGATSGLDDAGVGQGAIWQDVDNDEDMDLYLTNDGVNRAYIQVSPGTFAEVGGSLGINDSGSGRNVSGVDYDNDGDVDIFITNDSNQSNVFYLNQGGGSFVNNAGALGLGGAVSSRGSGFADYDNDGDLDLFVANDGTNKLYRSNGAVNNWLQVDITGVLDNEHGIGAYVTAYVGGVKVVRWVDGGSGYASQSTSVMTFGLGTQTFVDSVVVDWPSGGSQSETNVAANQLLAITQGSAEHQDIASSKGLDDSSGQGADIAWIDYDADGKLDLYVVNRGQANKLYRQDSSGNFTETGPGVGVDDPGDGRAGVVADFDNDGDLDIFVANAGQADRLYRNDGGTFVDVASGAGVEGLSKNGGSEGADWGDFNRDGFPDLYVARGGGENLLYVNRKNGVFDEISVLAGVADVANAEDVAWADYDRDGAIDIYVSNHSGGDNRLYRNNRNGTFTDMAATAGVDDGGGARSLAWGDFDHDRDLDLYVVNDGSPDVLYVNLGNGTFADGTNVAGLGHSGKGQDAVWFDLNNDGKPDLYIATYGGPNLFYESVGGGAFVERGKKRQIHDTGNSYAVAVADYDEDGDLDLYVANASPNRLFTNTSTANYVQIVLNGTVSGADALGAEVRVVAGTLAQDQIYEASTLHYGLNTETSIDTVLVEWPSGLKSVLVNQSVNQVLTLTEPSLDGFTDVTATANVLNTEDVYGASWYDYDDDGDQDLFLAVSNGTNLLYQNTGASGFTDETISAGLSDGVADRRSAVWGDFDSDGDADLYVGVNGANNLLYRNDGGVFSDVANVAGVDENGPALAVSWTDVNNDGNLDLLLVNDGAAFLYANNGDGTFSSLGSNPIFSGSFQSAAWSDYNNDGFQDLYLTVDGSNNLLYKNNQDETFTDMASTTGVTGGTANRGASWADYNNDGYLDLYLAQSNASNILYQGSSTNTFSDVSAFAEVDGVNAGRAVSWADYNNDTFLDLYVTNDGDDNVLYLNFGDGTFGDVSDYAGVADTTANNGAAWADYDGDGDLDLFVAALGDTSRLYENDTTGNNWLKLVLSPVGSASGIGTRVDVLASSNVYRRDVVADVNQNGSEVVLGLGSDSFVDSIYVSWPSGLTVALGNESANQILEVDEVGDVFKEVANAVGLQDGGAGFGAAWADFDGDEDLDVYVTNTGANALYENDGLGEFSNVASALGVDGSGTSHGVAWADYDNDGDLDLYVVNDGSANKLYENNGTGSFSDISSSALVGDTGTGWGVSWID